MASLVFPYLPIPKKDPKTGEIIGQVHYPFIPVRLVYRHQLSRNPIFCLVDSGAERNLFPAFYGEQLRIKIKKGNPKVILGIGGIKIKGFTHNVTLHIDTLSFKSQVDFSYDHEVPLLGRNGFFDKFKEVIFKEKEKVLELETNRS